MNKPRALDGRGLSLLLPSILSAAGLFCFAVLAYSFTELHSLPAEFRRWLVVVGALTLAAGSELGTLASVVDIYRKGGPRTWDWVALFFSLCTTVASFVLAFAALLLNDLPWVTAALDYGAVVLGVLAALDAYGGFMELGLYLNSHDARLDQWERRVVAESERQERLAAVLREDTQAGGTQAEDTQPLANVDIADRRQRLLSLYRAQPGATQAEVASALGVSASTVRNDLTVLEAQGRVRRNDGQLEVI